MTACPKMVTNRREMVTFDKKCLYAYVVIMLLHY